MIRHTDEPLINNRLILSYFFTNFHFISDVSRRVINLLKVLSILFFENPVVMVELYVIGEGIVKSS